MVIESWNYHAPTPMPEEELDGISDPLEIIARLTYHKWMEHNDVARQFDTSPGYFNAAYLQWAQDYRADGLFAHPLMSCRPATYTLMHTRNMLEEKLKVPGVVVPGDIIDLRVFNPDEAIVESRDLCRNNGSLSRSQETGRNGVVNRKRRNYP